MDIVAQEKKNNKRYLPHTVSTKEGAVKLYRQSKDVDFVLRRYHISKASLMRWSKLYDGTKESLMPKSHRPHSQHPRPLCKAQLIRAGLIEGRAQDDIALLQHYCGENVHEGCAAVKLGQAQPEGLIAL